MLQEVLQVFFLRSQLCEGGMKASSRTYNPDLPHSTTLRTRCLFWSKATLVMWMLQALRSS